MTEESIDLTELEQRADEEAHQRRVELTEALIGSFNPNERGDVSELKETAKAFAYAVYQHTPPSRRQSIALTHIEQAAMMAVKSLYS